MIRTMRARYPGRCAATGAAIRPGALIYYDTAARRATLAPVAPVANSIRPDYVSHVIDFGDGREYYRNKKGRCEDAPCCGCCTI